MSKKLQSFTIFKFNSIRLKQYNYKINLTLDEGRRNQEVVRLGNSQLLSVIRKVTNKVFDEHQLEVLEKEKREFSKQKDRQNTLRIMKEIDEMLFIDSLIEIKFDNKRHYERIIKVGLFVNGFEFVRILAGSGNLRRNTVFL